MNSDDSGPDVDEGNAYTTEPAEARGIIERHDGYPAHVERSEGEGDRGLLRVGFRETSGGADDDEELARISWEEFEAEFEEKDLALVYPEDPAERGREEFALVDRDAT